MYTRRARLAKHAVALFSHYGQAATFTFSARAHDVRGPRYQDGVPCSPARAFPVKLLSPADAMVMSRSWCCRQSVPPSGRPNRFAFLLFHVDAGTQREDKLSHVLHCTRPFLWLRTTLLEPAGRQSMVPIRAPSLCRKEKKEGGKTPLYETDPRFRINKVKECMCIKAVDRQLELR